jgi:hypothetical protein
MTQEHRSSISSTHTLSQLDDIRTNPIERLSGEIKPRTNVVGIFPKSGQLALKRPFGPLPAAAQRRVTKVVAGP